MSRCEDVFAREVLRGAAIGLALLIVGSHTAFAVQASPPTVTCTGHCQSCLEAEVGAQGERCVKCGIDPKCIANPGDPGLSSDFTAVVKAHNNYRNGQCADPLTWSSDLASAAQRWASACTPNGSGGFAHDPNRGSAGENLFWGTRAEGRQAVQWWYDEIKDYNFAAPKWSGKVGHFTQVVWKDSKHIGCGAAVCGGMNLWVCRYSPPGNWNVNNPGVLESQVGCAKSTAAQKGQANAPQDGGGDAGKMATAKNDVDIYNSPVEPRKVIGMMRGNSKASVLGHHQDGWCQLKAPAPGVATGWVADNHLRGC